MDNIEMTTDAMLDDLEEHGNGLQQIYRELTVHDAEAERLQAQWEDNEKQAKEKVERGLARKARMQVIKQEIDRRNLEKAKELKRAQDAATKAQNAVTKAQKQADQASKVVTMTDAAMDLTHYSNEMGARNRPSRSQKKNC